MNLVDWVISVMGAMGAPGVALLLFLECVFPPIPSEVILPLAGVTVGTGQHGFWSMLIWSLIGGVLGAYLLYGLGYAFGADRVRWLCEKLPLLEVNDFERTVAWFSKHGRGGIFFGRMVPGIRSLISIPAGIYKMSIVQFTALTLAGSAIWNSIFIGLGMLLGSNWHVIEPYTDVLSKVVYVLVAALGIWFVVSRLRRNHHRTKGE